MAEPNAHRPEIDPTMKALLDAVPFRITLADGVEPARSAIRQIKPPDDLVPQMRIEERRIGYGRVNEIPVRIYWPPITEHDRLPVVVFCHGGGWSIGDLDTHDPVARAHAVGGEAIVISVDYRLAPEHPYPAAVNDCWAALQWVGEHAAELGGDPARLAVAGDSAGGNLSAVVAQLARDNGGPSLAFQLLWYPMTVGDLTLPSFAENTHAPLLDDNAITAFLTWYLPEMDLSDPTTLPSTLAPANAESLAGLPPAYIAIAGHDPLHDDGAHYAELLKAADVAVELHDAPTLVHGYVSFALFASAAAEATDRGLAALKTALHP